MKKKISAKLLNHATKLDVSTWSLDAADNAYTDDDLASDIEKIIEAHRSGTEERLKKIVLSAANEVLSLAIKYDAHAWFPVEWDFGDAPEDGINGPLPTDPMTIYVTLPLGAEEYEGPTWGFSLRDLVTSLIDGNETDNGKIHIEENGDPRWVLKIRDGLRELAQMIDDAIVR